MENSSAQCYLQERLLAQQCWENWEVPTEASVKLRKPAPSGHPTQTHTEVHPRACGRQQHVCPWRAPSWRLQQEKGRLETQWSALASECPEAAQNSAEPL